MLFRQDFSFVTTGSSLGTLLTGTVGSYVNETFGWPYVFYTIGKTLMTSQNNWRAFVYNYARRNWRINQHVDFSRLSFTSLGGRVEVLRHGVAETPQERSGHVVHGAAFRQCSRSRSRRHRWQGTMADVPECTFSLVKVLIENRSKITICLWIYFVSFIKNHMRVNTKWVLWLLDARKSTFNKLLFFCRACMICHFCQNNCFYMLLSW